MKNTTKIFYILALLFLSCIWNQKKPVTDISYPETCTQDSIVFRDSNSKMQDDSYGEIISVSQVPPNKVPPTQDSLKKKIGYLTIISKGETATGATVLINDRLQGTMPIRDLSLLSGIHYLEIFKEGYKRLETQIEIRPNISIVFQVYLVKERSEEQ